MKNYLISILQMLFIACSITSCENNNEIDNSDLGNYNDGVYFAEVGYWNPDNEIGGMDYEASVEILNNKVIKINACNENKDKIITNPFSPALVRKEGYCNLIDDSGIEYTIHVIENLSDRKKRLEEENILAEKERLEMIEINRQCERRGDSLRELRTETNHDGLLYNGETQDYCSNCKGLISKNNETNEIFCWVCKTENDLKYKNIIVTAEDTKNFNEMRKIQKMIPGYNTMQAREWMHQKLFEYSLRQK